MNKIFNGIDSSNFRWKLECEEVFGEHGEFFCDKTDYINNDFQNMVQGALSSTLKYTNVL